VPIQATGIPWRWASDLRGNVFTREPARRAVIGQAGRVNRLVCQAASRLVFPGDSRS